MCSSDLLAAAIAEAGRIEVPSVDPREPIAVRAAQASRWTEGSYDVWHLTGGVRITQGSTEASAHEAVVWIEQDPGTAPEPDTSDEAGEKQPSPRGMLVRMAGGVQVRATGAAGESAAPAVVRGERWTGRF